MTACLWRLYMIVILSIISPAQQLLTHLSPVHDRHLVNHLTCTAIIDTPVTCTCYLYMTVILLIISPVQQLLTHLLPAKGDTDLRFTGRGFQSWLGTIA